MEWLESNDQGDRITAPLSLLGWRNALPFLNVWIPCLHPDYDIDDSKNLSLLISESLTIACMRPTGSR